MTNKEKKEYLLRYRTADGEITDLLREKDAVFTRLTHMTAAYDGMPHGTSAGDKMSAGAAKLDELDREIDRRIDTLVDFRHEIERYIDAIDNSNYRRCLRLRYMDGLKWDTIADLMHYDIDAKKIYVLHGHALTALQVGTERH